MKLLNKVSMAGIVLLLCMFFLPSCKSSKKVSSKKSKRVASVPILMADNYLDNKKIRIKAKINTKIAGKSLNFNTDIRMLKDSIIWVSAIANFPIKIEAGRALITRDSVKALDKLNKIYYAKTIDYLQELIGYPLSFDALQKLLLGQPFATQNALPQIDTDEGGYFILKATENNLTETVIVNPNDYTIKNININDSVNLKRISITQSDYDEVDKHLFPFLREVVAADVSANIKVNNVEVDEALSMPFKVSHRYKNSK